MSATRSSPLPPKYVTKREISGWAIKGVLYKAYVAMVLMLSAGRWDWASGWCYVAVFLLFDLASAIVVLPRSPGLLIERSTRHRDVASWDKVLMPLSSGLLPMISWILAGLNERYRWLPVVPPELQIGGTTLTVLGYAIVVWAMGSIAFFSVVVRLQPERGHQVARAGPYALVRHPGYLGAILFTAAVPLMLGSWWALLPALAAVILFLVRTELEDRFLQENLDGYRAFAQEVRERLIPGLW